MEGPLTILLVGAGGREHALAWKLSQSPLVRHIYACPGNGGTHQEQKTSNVNIPSTDFAALVDFAVHNDVCTAFYFSS